MLLCLPMYQLFIERGVDASFRWGIHSSLYSYPHHVLLSHCDDR